MRMAPTSGAAACRPIPSAPTAGSHHRSPRHRSSPTRIRGRRGPPEHEDDDSSPSGPPRHQSAADAAEDDQQHDQSLPGVSLGQRLRRGRHREGRRDRSDEKQPGVAPSAVSRARPSPPRRPAVPGCRRPAARAHRSAARQSQDHWRPGSWWTAVVSERYLRLSLIDVPHSGQLVPRRRARVVPPRWRCTWIRLWVGVGHVRRCASRASGDCLRRNTMTRIPSQ